MNRKYRKNSGVTLTELLVSVCILILIAALLLPAITKGFRRSKGWAWGVYAFQNNRIEAFLGEDAKLQQFYATNKPYRWSFITTDPGGPTVGLA